MRVRFISRRVFFKNLIYIVNKRKYFGEFLNEWNNVKELEKPILKTTSTSPPKRILWSINTSEYLSTVSNLTNGTIKANFVALQWFALILLHKDDVVDYHKYRWMFWCSQFRFPAQALNLQRTVFLLLTKSLFPQSQLASKYFSLDRFIWDSKNGDYPPNTIKRSP